MNTAGFELARANRERLKRVLVIENDVIVTEQIRAKSRATVNGAISNGQTRSQLNLYDEHSANTVFVNKEDPKSY